MTLQINITTLKALDDAAKAISKIIQEEKYTVICLRGELGAGKTAFAKHLIPYILQDDTENLRQDISSPTFNIMHHYTRGLVSLYHIDLYRIKYQTELQELGFAEILEHNICIIEWPEIADFLLPAKKILIEIHYDSITQERYISCSFHKI